MLVRIGKAHHTTGATDPQNIKARRGQTGLNGLGGGQRQRLAVIDDQTDPGH